MSSHLTGQDVEMVNKTQQIKSLYIYIVITTALSLKIKSIQKLLQINVDLVLCRGLTTKEMHFAHHMNGFVCIYT